jgi:Kinesin motor domain
MMQDSRSSLLFGYGISGSGKTHTIIGDAEQNRPGIIPRVLRAMVNMMKEIKLSFKLGLKF